MHLRSPNSLFGMHRNRRLQNPGLWSSGMAGSLAWPYSGPRENEPVPVLPSVPASEMTSQQHQRSGLSSRFDLPKEHIRFSDLIFTENVDAGPAQMCGGHTGGRDLGSGKSPVKNDVRSARRTAFL